MRLIHLFHPLKVLWHDRIGLFWPIWITLTAIAIGIGIWFVRPALAESAKTSVLRGRHTGLRDLILAILVLCPIVTCYAAGILVWEDFTYYDNSHFTNETLVGRDVPFQVSPEGGRFWPLGYQEFNLLRHVTSSVDGYHLLRMLQLLGVCAILLVLDEDIGVWCRIVLITLLLITPSIVISFSGLIYPEANIVFWLVCLVWFVQRFERSRSIVWALAAIVSAQILLYYKETAFLFVLGFAIGRLILRYHREAQTCSDRVRLKDPESRLDLCLVIVVAMFSLYYFVALYPQFGARYAESRRLPLLQVVGMYLKLDLLAWVFIGVLAVRLFMIVRRSLSPSLFWEGVAIGGACCFVGYIILGMESGYYLAPADVVAVLYLGRLGFACAEGMSVVAKVCAITVLLVIVVQDSSLSAFRMYERKNVIHAKSEMAQLVKGRYQSSPRDVRRLFFPFATPFQILEFASYLSYIGVPVEEQLANEGDGGILLVGNKVEKDGPCGYRVFVCHPGGHPEARDLVIVLPDDVTTSRESKVYRQAGPSLLFSYDPSPLIPDWLRPFVNRLHVVSPVFSRTALPDSWLTASISEWK